jgi:tetratricopeptide (TPR) repeat protein
MELKLKSISPDSLEEANSKAHHYRLLNEPEEAESICQDVLAVDPENQTALRILGLAITDQFGNDPSERWTEAERAFERLSDAYDRLYHMGILHERRAKAQLRGGRSPHAVLVLLQEAMRCFEEAEKLRPPNNDEALLRWNRCLRLMQSYPAAEWHRQIEVEAVDAGDSTF